MKSGALANSLVLGGVLIDGVFGHPLGFLKKRSMKTEIVFVTETVADAVVYVDENSIPYSTSRVQRVSSIPTLAAETTPVLSTSAIPTTVYLAPTPVESFPTSVPLASPAPSAPSSSVIVPVPTSTSMAPLSKSPEPTASSDAPPPPPPTTAPEPNPSPMGTAPAPIAKVSEVVSHPEPKPSINSEDRFPLGITYDPFKGVPGQCQCKTADEMTAEFEKMKEFGIMRIYGNDCGVIPVAVQQAKKNGQKLMAGIYTPDQNIDTVVEALSNAVDRYNGGNWDIISLISVENERVNAHVITVSDAHDSVSQAQEALKDVGYTGPVGVVETAPAVIDNPSLCEKSDMALVNIHAFFDPNTKAEDSGDFVKSEVARVKEACPGKRVVVTESGWPSQGTSHDQAVASKDAQRAAIKSIRAAFKCDLFLFNAFDSPWKTDDSSTWNSERYWGIL
ncbi:glycoside hydrolase family 17 protein [Lentithecium fluviatile CBS 122367]|uniref:Glycoside hydrolase family 17 protein n=1 Tax=Lentithecium fluviatile CBS 122367 TaxID=1168545 RepID=A0A6G1J5I0_9PLEO|nr:glycoside hydrolase family 17 protein [Lentithecium fluviatile CBS 122367]